MNVSVNSKAATPQASAPPPALRTNPVQTERLSVWDERARKMGFPPSSR
jgi:predicted Zn-dependent protease